MLGRPFATFAALLILAIAFYLGATAVRAQGETQLSLASVNTRFDHGVVGVINRVLVRGDFSEGTGQYVPFDATPPCPGSSPIVGLDGGQGIVVLENGDVWHFSEGAWNFAGNMLNGILASPSTTAEATFTLTAVPNPTSRSLSLTYTLTQSSDVAIELLDLQGRVLLHKVRAGISGRNAVSISLAESAAPLTTGNYFVRLRAKGRVATTKVVLVD